MTPQSIIDDVRPLINDTVAPYRYSDVFLAARVNSALKRAAILRHDLFSVFGTVTCAAGSVLQRAPADSIRIMEVIRVVGGPALTESNRETMDQIAPGWMNAPPAQADTWARHPRDQNQFFVSPPPPASPAQVLQVEYAQYPPIYAIGATIAALPDAFSTALVDCTVFLTQSIDDEHVNSGRAKMFMDSFTAALGADAQQKVVTDTETAGTPRGTEV